MFGLNILRNAVSTLAANVLGLATTVQEINASLRQRAALDRPDPGTPLALVAPMPGKASTLAQDAWGSAGDPEAVETPPPGGYGRRRKAAEAPAGR
jgi:hypothetical protein